jgi:hypothetical protein
LCYRNLTPPVLGAIAATQQRTWTETSCNRMSR